MRVLLVLGTSAGGVGRHVAALAAGLADAGEEVLVAGPAVSLPGSVRGMRVREVPISDRPRPAMDLAATRALRRLLRRADIVHAHGLRAGALACLAATGTSVPVVVTLHNAAPADGPARTVYALLERLVARRAATVLAVSRDLLARAETLGARHTGLAVVPAPDRVEAVRPRPQVRASLELADGCRLLLSVGRLTPQKDFDVLLDAVGLLSTGGDPGFLAVVVGEGPLEQHLRQRVAAERLPVLLTGPRDDVPALLAACDLVVSSAHWEGQPLWLQEALQAGAAIVATDAGGTRDTLRGAGRLVPVGDAASLAERIRAVLGDEAESRRLRTASRDAALRLPSEADAVAAALSTYQDATGR